MTHPSGDTGDMVNGQRDEDAVACGARITMGGVQFECEMPDGHGSMHWQTFPDPYQGGMAWPEPLRPGCAPGVRSEPTESNRTPEQPAPFGGSSQ